MNAAQTAFPSLADLAAALDSLGRADLAAKALADNESFATLYLEGRPVAGISRPRIIGGDKLYSLALTDGRVVAVFHTCPTVRRCLEAVYSYARATLPADCNPAEELGSYLESFADNWANGEAGLYLVFRAAAKTRAARWARRIALAQAAVSAVTIESGPVGEDWQPALKSESFYAQEIGPDGAAGRFAFGPSEAAAREALARKAAAPCLKAAAPAFSFPLPPIKAPATLWPVNPPAAFADLARVMGAF